MSFRRMQGSNFADKKAPCLAILINRDAFFLSHFAERALTAKQAGYRVIVFCPDRGMAKKIIEAGFEFCAVEMSRHGIHVIREVCTLLDIASHYRRVSPDVCWHVGLKPIILGTAALKLAGRSGVVNAPVGLGFIFSSQTLKARLLRFPMMRAMKAFLNPPGSRVVFENADDLQELLAVKAVRREYAILIRGAGVDVTRYARVPEYPGIPTVLFAARLIWEKGVREFVEAARLLRQRGIVARFLIAGGIDQESDSAVPQSILQDWVQEGNVEWLGQRNDMPDLLGTCHIFCLPTWYREGLPKVILEAMACGRAVVATDMPGCREAVKNMDNGLLVPPKNVVALADAISFLLGNASLRARMGARGRERVEREFSSDKVCQETLAIFDQLSGRLGNSERLQMPD